MTPRVRAARTTYRCADCGAQAAQWVGRCPSCQAWGTLEATAAPAPVDERGRVDVAAEIDVWPTGK